jgi:hypothetical protein
MISLNIRPASFAMFLAVLSSILLRNFVRRARDPLDFVHALLMQNVLNLAGTLALLLQLVVFRVPDQGLSPEAGFRDAVPDNYQSENDNFM